MKTHITKQALARLREDLSDRDREILSTLDCIRVASGHQLDRLHFAELAKSGRSSRRRAVMRRLVRTRLVCQLDRRVGGVRAGSAGAVYTLGLAGQKLLRPDQRARTPITPSWPFLAHALGVTDLLVDLVKAEQDGRLHVVRFAAEPGSWLDMPGRAPLKPDASATVDVGRWRYQLAFEVDCGTESLNVVAAQLRRYEDAYRLGITAQDSSVFPRVMWRVETTDRGVAIAGLIERLAHPELFSVHEQADITDAVITGPEDADAA